MIFHEFQRNFRHRADVNIFERKKLHETFIAEIRSKRQSLTATSTYLSTCCSVSGKRLSQMLQLSRISTRPLHRGSVPALAVTVMRLPYIRGCTAGSQCCL